MAPWWNGRHSRVDDLIYLGNLVLDRARSSRAGVIYEQLNPPMTEDCNEKPS